jgi:putative restriction endonuclease
MTLTRAELTARFEDGLQAAGCEVTLETGREERPILLQVRGPFGASSLRAFIWNITPGGPAGVRREGEYRVQTTRPGDAPFLLPGERTTLLLGFHEERMVFAGWDVRLHPNPGSSSSLQVSLSTLEEAGQEGFASQIRAVAGGGDEVVFAFLPEHVTTYLSAVPRIVAGEPSNAETQALDRAGSGEPPDVEELPADVERQVAIREIAVVVRDARFRTRVVAAYGGKCAFCGLGADLVEAAHIVGVAAGGPDLVANGVAACPTHHRAFDRGFVNVGPALTIHVNSDRLASLGVNSEEINALEAGMLGELHVPETEALRPRRDFLAQHRTRWD